ncbi:MAG: S8 family serine peptidase [Actinomycetota bacterium]|nr:S8 family serine peptidase [Actinomycetota bacterium]
MIFSCIARDPRRKATLAAVTVPVAMALAAMGLASCSAAPSAPAALATAPRWVSSTPWSPHRPRSCPAPRPDPNTATAGQPSSATGTFPWPPPPAGTNPTRYRSYLHTPSVFPPVRPSNWSQSGNDWKLTSARTDDAAINRNPQELCGVQGNSVDTAWQTTTGRPSTVIAVTDSGIEWCDTGIVDKIYLNTAALPPPENAQGVTKAALGARGAHFSDTNPYDLYGTGVVNAAQYAQDPRVAAVARAYGGPFCSVPHGSYPAEPGVISPMDLIRTFGTPTMPGPYGTTVKNPYYYGRQGPRGFTEAIAGWNFVNNDNNPYDNVHYDHGTGEAKDSTGAANTLAHEVGACPDCMVLPVRVGDSFIASANAFAQGVLFAVDSGASLVQEALGTYDITATARQAVAYAEAHGVPVVASAADEEAQHHNLPSLLAHTIVVNSVTRDTSFRPPSDLYLNGCTNYGANIAVSVESSSCSSEATGKTAGIVGLAESAAANAMRAGHLKPYPGLRSVTGQPVALSVNEIRQLVMMSASPVDFGKAAPPYGPANNYTVSAPGIPLAKTTRYPSQPGFNQYFGYGRIDAARMIGWIAHGDIPPEAQINSPSWFGLFGPSQALTVTGVVGTPRAPAWRYQVDVGVGPQPAPGTWRLVEQGTGQGVRTGTLARVPLAEVARLFPKGTSFTGGPVGPAGSPAPDRFTFSVRVVVQVTEGPTKGMVGISRRAELLHRDQGLLSGYPKRFGSSIDAPPTLAPLGPGDTNVLLVATASGTIDALLPDGRELPGFPVHTAPLAYHAAEQAFASRAVTAVPRGEIIGGVAVGDLARAGGHHPDVVTCDLAGRCYAWNAHGRLLPGWPVRTDPAYSSFAAANEDNRVLPGIFGAPALADLTGNGSLDVVAASMDRHVYAWGPSGQRVPGWPVLVVDAAKVASVDPVTNQVTFLPSAHPLQGTKLMDTPAIGNLGGGTGPPDVVVGSNEEYAGPVDASLGSGPLGTFLSLAGILSGAGNAELYAIYPNGALHSPAPGSPAPRGLPDPGAFLPGWPAAVADFEPGLLPDVGDGIVNSPALADVSGNGQLDVGVISAAGPGYVLTPKGTSAIGTSPSGKPDVLASSGAGPSANSTGVLGTSLPALGGPAFAPLGPRAPGVSMVAPALSIGRLLDEAEPADQTPHQSQLDAWSARTGSFDPGFPQVLNDMAFVVEPIVADVGGAGKGPYVVAGSATYDIRALDASGREAPGFPKFTGGWMVNSPSFGPFGALGTQVLAAGTREGFLFVWQTPTPACAPSGPWPREHHDLWNTGNLQVSGAPSPSCRPARVAKG